MTRFLSFAVLGVAAIGFTLASPAVSHAQSFGVHLDVGRTHIDVGRSSYALPTVYSNNYLRYDCVPPAYPHHHHHHHAFSPRPVVVTPEIIYATPSPGYRSDYYSPYGARVIVRP